MKVEIIYVDGEAKQHLAMNVVERNGKVSIEDDKKLVPGLASFLKTEKINSNKGTFTIKDGLGFLNALQFQFNGSRLRASPPK